MTSVNVTGEATCNGAVTVRVTVDGDDGAQAAPVGIWGTVTGGAEVRIDGHGRTFNPTGNGPFTVGATVYLADGRRTSAGPVSVNRPTNCATTSVPPTLGTPPSFPPPPSSTTATSVNPTTTTTSVAPTTTTTRPIPTGPITTTTTVGIRAVDCTIVPLPEGCSPVTTGPTVTLTPPATLVSVPPTLPRTGAAKNADVAMVGGGLVAVGVLLVLASLIGRFKHRTN